MTTPENETIKPTTFIMVMRSFRKIAAPIGVTKGISAMMAEPMIGEVFFKP